MSERITFGDQRRWDLFLKLASLLCTALLIPGISWAFAVHREIGDLGAQIQLLHIQAETDRKGVSAILTEIRALRESVDSMRADFLQRLTRVETRLDQNK
jgi:hypothetical protein